MEYKVPLVMTPQPEGGYTVTSPALPELITEGDTLSDALENAKDALAAVIELYEEDGRLLPRNIWITEANGPVVETVIAASDVAQRRVMGSRPARGLAALPPSRTR